jgi:5-methylcytosine-specific restriction endonuclease McrA
MCSQWFALRVGDVADIGDSGLSIEPGSPFWSMPPDRQLSVIARACELRQLCKDMGIVEWETMTAYGGMPHADLDFGLAAHRRGGKRLLERLAASNEKILDPHRAAIAEAHAIASRVVQARWANRRQAGTKHRRRRPSPCSGRRIAFLRDGKRCRYCGKPTGHDFHIDHVIPKSIGGDDCAENLVVACSTCNLKKAGRTPAEAGMPLLPIPSAIAPTSGAAQMPNHTFRSAVVA